MIEGLPVERLVVRVGGDRGAQPPSNLHHVPGTRNPGARPAHTPRGDRPAQYRRLPLPRSTSVPAFRRLRPESTTFRGVQCINEAYGGDDLVPLSLCTLFGWAAGRARPTVGPRSPYTLEGGRER